jgi:hypothetical protein
MRKSLFYITFIFLFFSCEKSENEIGNDKNLQKFWKLKGFYDENNNPINPPAFNPDTMFHFEINMMILWNDYSKAYEIQGQGPHDIFWGEFLPIQQGLEFKSLETTGHKADVKAVDDFDRLFFQAIKEVSSYTISNKRLIFKYENDSKKMIFELKDKQYIYDSEYFTAKINGLNWSGDEDYISAEVIYDYTGQKVRLDFGASSEKTLSDQWIYNISISTSLSPQKGEFEFNNDGFLQTINGSMGICTGRKGDEQIDTRSTDGVFGITTISRSFIEGYFYFEAEGYGENKQIQRSVSDGRFLIILNSPPGWFKPYEFNNN